MSLFLHQLELSAPLFLLVLLGYGAMRLGGWGKEVSESCSKVVVNLVVPPMLFHMMSDFSRLPPVDARLLFAFFGGCLLVFALGRLLAWKVFGLDGTQQSVFALGGVFCNNVMLGLPMARLLLGEEALPSAALVVVFNALLLWTLVTVSVEWARHGHLSAKGFGRTAKGVLTNPVVAAILAGSLWGLAGWKLPPVLDSTLVLAGSAGVPLSLIALGMGVAEFGAPKDWRLPAAMTALKLVLHPLAVWCIARLLGLPAMETQVVVLMASIATGMNVYLMARHFNTMEGQVASGILLSTALAAVTSPLALAYL